MVERVRYEVDGWGGGELGFVDGLVAWHELPVVVAADVRGDRDHSLVDRIRSYLAGSPEAARTRVLQARRALRQF